MLSGLQILVDVDIDYETVVDDGYVMGEEGVGCGKRNRSVFPLAIQNQGWFGS